MSENSPSIALSKKLSENHQDTSVLDLSGLFIYYKDMPYLTTFLQQNSHINAIVLHHTYITDDVLIAIANLGTITDIDARYNSRYREYGSIREPSLEASTGCVEALAAIPGLTHLALPEEFANAAEVFAKIPTLTYVCIEGLNDKGVTALASNPSITHLTLGGAKIGTDSFTAIASSNVTHLVVHQRWVGRTEVGPDEAAILATSASIKTLNLSGNKIGHKGALALAQNKVIEELVVDHCSLRDDDIAPFGANATLKRINLRSNLDITDNGAIALSASSSLISVEFGKPQFAGPHSDIEGQLISGTKVTAKGEAAIAKMQTMNKVKSLSGEGKGSTSLFDQAAKLLANLGIRQNPNGRRPGN